MSKRNRRRFAGALAFAAIIAGAHFAGVELHASAHAVWVEAPNVVIGVTHAGVYAQCDPAVVHLKVCES
jgi:hypothetical protein